MSVKIFARILTLLVLACSLNSFAAPRTVLVQLFEWPWADVAKECEAYLGPQGFAAVQISPPHEHLRWNTTPWWDRYQVVSYNIISRGGDEAQFTDMVRRCQAVGVDIYADVVINHMTGMIDGEGFAGTKFSHYDHPGLYSYNDFHHCGRNGDDNIKNYRDRYEVQNCELVDLADLATESEYVRTKIADYMNHLLDLGVKGFRVDAAKHIPAADLAAIYRKLKRSPYIYQEIIYDPGGPIQYSEYTPYGDVFAYDYTHVLADGLRNKRPGALKTIASNFPASDKSVVSITNHDLERHDSSILSINGPEQHMYRLAQIFMLAWPYGYPQLYSGYRFDNFDQGPPVDANLRTLPILDSNYNCQGPWTCEHRLKEVAAMVEFRNRTDRVFSYNNWWSNGYDQIAFGRGNAGFVVINYSVYEMNREFQTSLPAGQYCNILDTNYDLVNRQCAHPITVQSDGTFIATLSPFTAIAMIKYTKAQLRK